MASSNVRKEKMHEANNERWNMYYTVQGHKMKELQESRGVKEMNIKEMQESRELKIMATDTSNMPAERQEYFAQEVTRIMKARKQRAEDADTQEE